MLERPLPGVGEHRRGGVPRGVEAGPERRVREPVVGLLQPGRGALLLTQCLGRLDEQGDPALQEGGVLGHAAGAAARLGQHLCQRRLFRVESFAP